ncbi:hypothetical protein HPB52_012505 [Rhipicephalus sanguineus]|uniref:Sulfotransferase domain-containing protein n=1 Tax=Rhipicephalus sanguineus TaxID=34632 RepID=A0A9D4QAV3_RHISA|nr:hypothetical protein HPB52_012505 [Rhipicephalus sanguineus]
MNNRPTELVEMHEGSGFVRNYFTEDQIKETKEWIARKTQGSDESYRFVEGVWMHKYFRDEAIRSAIRYKPREGDIVVVTYPKCGTNWTVFIVYSILTRGKQPSNTVEYQLMCPFIDMAGAGVAEDPSRTGPMFTHLPMRVFPPVENAQYVYVARNPYDCAVSFYHFLKGMTRKDFTDVSFEAFLLLFLSGKVMYGDYFDHLLPCILTRGKQPSDIVEYHLMCPLIDSTGSVLAENPSRKGPIFTHLPMRVFSPVENAKYLYVARNPYDCAVSFYHFLKGFTPKTFTDVSFERFLTLFLSGKALYGDYFDHLLPWYERRNDANVLFLTYEELKADTRSQVLKIAEFVGEYHAAALREHDDVLQDVMNASSLENMRAFFSEMPLETVMKVAAKASYNSFCAELLKNLPRGIDEMHEGAGFVRKGIVGPGNN